MSVWVSTFKDFLKHDSTGIFHDRRPSQHFNLSEPPLTRDDLPETDALLCPSYLLCTEEEVLLVLGSLDVSKSNGHDGISARMLRSTSHSIAPAITKLFKMSIASGKLPKEWKSSLVVPKKVTIPTHPITVQSLFCRSSPKHLKVKWFTYLWRVESD